MQYKLEYRSPLNLWGHAVTYTRVDFDGKMWVGNDEYENQVNFCPFTGTPAPVQMNVKNMTNYKRYYNESAE
jgi:hypothetical protein